MSIQEDSITIIREEGEHITLVIDEVDLHTSVTESSQNLVSVLVADHQETIGQEPGDTVTVNEGGIPGPPGPAGGTYKHTQLSPSTDWFIEHNLGFEPAVTTVDSAGTKVEGDITYLGLNSLTVHFSTAFAGAAFMS